MTEIHAKTDDGATVSALDEGSGPTLLVVHPGGGSIEPYDEVARVLAEDHRVVRIRRRIYAEDGARSLPGHSMGREAADVLAVARLIGPPLLLVGHSSGAVAALEAAVRNPSAFAGMVAYEPPMPTTSLLGGPALVGAQHALRAGDPAEAMRIHLQDIVGMPGAMVEMMLAHPGIRQLLVGYAAAQITEDASIDALGVGVERFKGLRVPVTLIEGELSPGHLRQRVADLAAALPDVDVVTLAGQGHIAHLEDPRSLADTIRAAAGRGDFYPTTSRSPNTRAPRGAHRSTRST